MTVVLEKTTEQEFDTLILEAEKYCERRDPAALDIIGKVAGMAKQSGNLLHLTLSNYIRSYYDCFVANKYDDAVSRLNGSLALLDDEALANVGYKLLMTLGNSYQLKGELFSAQQSYMKGLRALESKKSLNKTEKDFLAAFYLNLSTLLSNSEIKIEAQEYLETAISIYKENGNKYKTAKCHTSYANMLEGRGDYVGAFVQMENALKLDIELKNEYSIALSKANLGILSVRAGLMENCYTFIVEALAFYESKKLRHETALVKMELGRSLLDVNRIDEALVYLTGAETIFILTGNKKELSIIYRAKADIFTKQSRHKLANRYLEKYISSLKFFFDNEKVNALTRAKNEFETELREKETELLREKNKEVQRYTQKLEASNTELLHFAHAASHDLREPLRTISTFTSMLKMSLGQNVTDDQNTYIGYVLTGANGMQNVIQGMLDLAKVDANPKKEHLPLEKVMQEVKLNLDTLIKEKNAVVHAYHLPMILANHSQMIQLFQNLVANGIKYNHSDRPTISISFQKVGETLEINVADNGIGIPENAREKVFKMFSRLDRKDTVGGSGIGLAVCKKIVDNMNGTITVHANGEGGTIMKLTFTTAQLA